VKATQSVSDGFGVRAWVSLTPYPPDHGASTHKTEALYKPAGPYQALQRVGTEHPLGLTQRRGGGGC
jgi:hypothetical protein